MNPPEALHRITKAFGKTWAFGTCSYCTKGNVQHHLHIRNNKGKGRTGRHHPTIHLEKKQKWEHHTQGWLQEA